MDPVTHSVFAVCCTVAITRLPERRKAVALAGLAGGLWPDADVFLRSTEDPLFQLEYHRHFTHSLAFSPVMMLIAAASAWGLLRLFGSRTGFLTLLWPALVAVWSHIFCDLWTSYGTRVFWPFSSARPGFDWISVIDPLMTLPVLVFALIAVFWNSRRASLAGLAWVGLYLCLCLGQKHRAEAALDQLIASRGHTAMRLNVKPSFANILVWRATYQTGDGRYHAAAIRPGWPGDVKVKPGESTPILPGPTADGSTLWEGLPGSSRAVADVRRFYHFSDDWVAWFPGGEGKILGDMRYAQMPDTFKPMWGIGLHPNQPEKHVDWMTFRALSRESFAPLWEMICARGF